MAPGHGVPTLLLGRLEWLRLSSPQAAEWAQNLCDWSGAFEKLCLDRALIPSWVPGGHPLPRDGVQLGHTLNLSEPVSSYQKGIDTCLDEQGENRGDCWYWGILHPVRHHTNVNCHGNRICPRLRAVWGLDGTSGCIQSKLQANEKSLSHGSLTGIHPLLLGFLLSWGGCFSSTPYSSHIQGSALNTVPYVEPGSL